MTTCTPAFAVERCRGVVFLTQHWRAARTRGRRGGLSAPVPAPQAEGLGEATRRAAVQASFGLVAAFRARSAPEEALRWRGSRCALGVVLAFGIDLSFGSACAPNGDRSLVARPRCVSTSCLSIDSSRSLRWPCRLTKASALRTHLGVQETRSETHFGERDQGSLRIRSAHQIARVHRSQMGALRYALEAPRDVVLRSHLLSLCGSSCGAHGRFGAFG